MGVFVFGVGAVFELARCREEEEVRFTHVHVGAGNMGIRRAIESESWCYAR